MGQDHICLSATSVDNPHMTCLMGNPYGPKGLPAKLLEIPEHTNREGASKGQSGQERSYQFVYQTKGVYTAKTWCIRIAHVEVALTTDGKPLTLPKGKFNNALASLLSDKEVTRQATLQNRAAIDYLLLLHGHRCEEFEGLCCFNLLTKDEDVHKAIQSIQGMHHTCPSMNQVAILSTSEWEEDMELEEDPEESRNPDEEELLME
ncbi:hypothetical protein DUI87_24401 [Hirundo rustica rustica]|uniref:Uncharacterized protein n=1 Tax=Hirundo rustica rustica TaxID=333673 RepID=A0A3M0JCF8_HIRRU|nr:hypothetical protein DUI87_24401 [Hirundo rustica rustica]